MEWNIEYISVDKYIKITSEGVFSIDEHPRLFQKLLSFEHWKPGISLLFDNRNFDFGQINTDKLRAASNHYQSLNKELGNGKVALLMKSPVDFGHGRQFEMLSDGKGDLEICVFREEEAALRWILETNLQFPVSSIGESHFPAMK